MTKLYDNPDKNRIAFLEGINVKLMADNAKLSKALKRAIGQIEKSAKELEKTADLLIKVGAVKAGDSKRGKVQASVTLVNELDAVLYECRP